MVLVKWYQLSPGLVASGEPLTLSVWSKMPPSQQELLMGLRHIKDSQP